MIFINSLEVEILSRQDEILLKKQLDGLATVPFKSRVPNLPYPLESVMVSLQHARDWDGKNCSINDVVRAYLDGNYATHNSQEK